MMNFKNRTENQQIIMALIEGKEVQCKFEDEDWEDYDPKEFFNFGPWLCTDEYQWRIKPKPKEIALKFTVTKTLTLEGVKNHHYKAGEQVYFIEKHGDGYEKYKCVPLYDTYSQVKPESELIFFETEEAMNKAYEQIINAQKGL